VAGSLSIEEALRRLESALDGLEDAVDRRFERAAEVAGLEGELHRLGTDRSRLAQSLDAAEARASRLEDVNREVSRGLVSAMESIRDMLSRHGA
jgi:chromosome segregation ATPase